MSTKMVSPAPPGPVSKEKCRHYWIIESPKGLTSKGFCKFCGEVREFRNSWSFTPPGKPGEPASAPPEARLNEEPAEKEDKEEGSEDKVKADE